MKSSPDFEYPPDKQKLLHKAKRLEWLTIAYLISVTLLMYFVLGSSQAMKTAWIEDLLSLIPPAVFLIASKISSKPPSKRFPYGYHRVTSIAFLAASLALLSVGLFLLGDSLVKLIKQEHPTIGGFNLFGQTVWLGWLMIPALLWSGIPAVILGRAKLPLASELHDKVLYADAQMNKADWLTAFAALVGIILVGAGYWWGDAVAAALISLDIIHDGWKNLSQVTFDLMDEVPYKVDRSEPDPIPDKVRSKLLTLSWVQQAKVRMREEGHIYFGEAFIVTERNENISPETLDETTQLCKSLHWRIHDLVVVPVPDLREANDNTKGEEEDD